MKKTISFLMCLLFGFSVISNVFAVGENEDEQTSCEAVNQQSLAKEKGSSSAGEGGAGPKGTQSM